MKRFWIILLVAALAIVVAIPAGARDINCDDEEKKPYTPNHPTCVEPQPKTTTTTATTTTTEPPGFADCSFPNGVLEGWHGKSVYRCIWKELGDADTFTLEIRAS
jgi:hypothetical protein